MENRSTERKINSYNVTLSTANPIWTVLGQKGAPP